MTGANYYCPLSPLSLSSPKKPRLSRCDCGCGRGKEETKREGKSGIEMLLDEATTMRRERRRQGGPRLSVSDLEKSFLNTSSSTLWPTTTRPTVAAAAAAVPKRGCIFCCRQRTGIYGPRPRPRPPLLPPVHLSQAKKRQKRKEIRQEGRADSTQRERERGDLKGFVRPSCRPSLKVARSYASQKGD